MKENNKENEKYEKLQEVKNKCSNKHASAFKIWKTNWDAICPFFQFSDKIRKIMYTANTIKSLENIQKQSLYFQQICHY